MDTQQFVKAMRESVRADGYPPESADGRYSLPTRNDEDVELQALWALPSGRCCSARRRRKNQSDLSSLAMSIDRNVSVHSLYACRTLVAPLFCL